MLEFSIWILFYLRLEGTGATSATKNPPLREKIPEQHNKIS